MRSSSSCSDWATTTPEGAQTVDCAASARFSAVTATGVVDIQSEAAALDRPGFWAVVMGFGGGLRAVRFEQVRSIARVPARPATAAGSTNSLPTSSSSAWRTSLDRAAYRRAVAQVREAIADGTVYQVNVCRVLEREVPVSFRTATLDHLLRQHNPAQHAARIHVPEAGLDVVCASPELYLRRIGAVIGSGPIKGTAVSLEQMLPKDYAENVMITDLVRNDLQPVCRPGTVAVRGLCRPEGYPGSVHLVSHVTGALADGVSWPQILAASFPPGSVSGAPKSSALGLIDALEPVDREIYCGAVGYVDNRDPREPRAELAVTIRTFWRRGNLLRFGVGAGITWPSDPDGEWWETDLKARRLLSLADRAIDGGAAPKEE